MTDKAPAAAAPDTATQHAPYKVQVEEGKRYFWCRCGKSATQPFCDGAHKGSEHTPLAYEAKKDGELFFCGCRASKRQPLCDGTHQRFREPA